MSPPTRRIATLDDARAVLEELGAPQRLITHGHLVAEAANALLAACRALDIEVDRALVQAGAMLHDAGKSLHRAELEGPGALHEEEGQRLLLARGVDDRVARCCVSHARWATLECSFEELLVALSDKLWKGVRVPALEMKVIDAAAARLNADRWSIFVGLDSAFEMIANEGPARLARSIA